MRTLSSAGLVLTLIAHAACNAPFALPAGERLIATAPNLRLVLPAASPEQGRNIAVDAAKSFLRTPLLVQGLRFEPDPVGFVRAAWWHAGHDLYTRNAFANPDAHGLDVLYASAQTRRALFTLKPKPGDLVFFGTQAETTVLTQVALVEQIDPDGTVHALGRFSKGPRRIALNLRHPEQEKSETGKTLNDTLGAAEGKPAGSLFLTYARPY